MKPIAEFPYEKRMRQTNDMHERMLLLQMKSNIGKSFALGYYDAVNDVFNICTSGYQNTENHKYDERHVSGNYSDHEYWHKSKYFEHDWNNCMYPNYYCIMPEQFTNKVGTRRILGFMTMDDVLTEMKEKDMFIERINEILDGNPKYSIPYLLCTKDRRFTISDIGCFCKVGNQFSGCRPCNIKRSIYHLSCSIPRDTIQYVAKLEELDGIQ